MPLLGSGPGQSFEIPPSLVTMVTLLSQPPPPSLRPPTETRGREGRPPPTAVRRCSSSPVCEVNAPSPHHGEAVDVGRGRHFDLVAVGPEARSRVDARPRGEAAPRSEEVRRREYLAVLMVVRARRAGAVAAPRGKHGPVRQEQRGRVVVARNVHARDDARARPRPTGADDPGCRRNAEPGTGP